MIAKAMVPVMLLLAAAPALADDAADRPLLDRGRAAAEAGDCVACHTAPGGEPFAGGRAMRTPIGDAYSTNITPDRATGIGDYSFDQFDRALRQGVAKDGHHLYPAMPYPAYAKIDADDMRALYAYFMTEVPAVNRPNRPADIPWPLSMRWPLGVWNSLFTTLAPFRPHTDHDAQWNRGAYLVEGLGHCGSCHTPRGLTFAEKAQAADDGALFLAGGSADGWFAKSLRGGKGGGLAEWSGDALVRFLASGRTESTAAFGAMTEVIEHSTQHLPESDLAAIAAFLKSLPGSEGTPAQADGTTEQALLANGPTSPGAIAYVEHCAACHRLDGGGIAGIFPALAGNSALTTRDASSIIRITLEGGAMAHAGSAPAFVMPGFSRLDDRQLAELLTFVRSGWGNRAGAVSASDVAAIRRSVVTPLEARPARFAPDDVDLPPGPATDRIRLGRRLLTETRRLLPDNVGADLNCTSCHLFGGKLAFGSPFVGVAGNFPSYAPRAGRQITLQERINGCFLRSMNGKAVPADSEQMAAMMAYFDWLAAGIPTATRVAGSGIGKIDPALVADPVNGKRIYQSACAACHGSDGQGLKDARGRTVFPALWGPNSFNLGAGMARSYTAAAFVKRNMPIAVNQIGPLGQGGMLSDQEALDVAEYFTHQDRPDFAPKVKDWPNGGKPKDSRY